MKKRTKVLFVFLLLLIFIVPSYVTFGNASQGLGSVTLNYEDTIPVLVIAKSQRSLDNAYISLGTHVLGESKGHRVGDSVKTWLLVDREGLQTLKVLKESGQIVNYLVKFKPKFPDIKKLLDVKSVPSPPKPTLFEVTNIIGSSKVNTELGFSGKGVRIAIVDTGVDYSNPDLRNSLEYVTWQEDGQVFREPLVLDADETQIVTFVEIHDENEDGWSDETSMTSYTYYPLGTEEVYNNPVYIDGIPSASGEYKFGMIDEWTGIRLPILLTDPNTPGNYTLAIIDWDEDGNFTDQFIDESNFYTYDGNRITYWDNPTDGIPGDYDGEDLSVGVLGGFFYDWWWNFDWISRYYPGWDLEGNYLSIFYDFYGHGTECAASAASRGDWSGLVGVAPNATIVGIKGLAYGVIEPGWLWAAGFDVDNFGTYYYTGEKRVDIVSNSFGLISPLYDYFGFGYDFESIMANSLTVPGYLDPDFPGIIMVFAGGNEGFGYGTVSSGGTASGVITVGASTSFDSTALIFLGLPGYWAVDGGRDEVMTWSSRGPSPLGEIKPDVLNIGAWAWVPAPFFYGGIDIFGGTSMATPLTAGVLALMVEASDGLTPYEYKSILESTAKDLDNDPFLQGAGRVDAYNATLAVLAMTRNQWADRPILRISTTKTGEEISKMIDMAWLWNWKYNIPNYFSFWFTNFFNIDPNLPVNFMDDSANLFLGTVKAGRGTSFRFQIANLYQEDIRIVDIKAVSYKLIDSQTEHTLIPATDQYVYLTFDRNQFMGADLVRFSLSIPYRYFDKNMDYTYEDRYRMWIFAWQDSDNTPGPSEDDDFILLSYVYPAGTKLEATIGNPVDDIPPGYNVAILLQSASGTFDTPVDFGIYKYMRIVDTSFRFRLSDRTLAPGETTTIFGRLRVPKKAEPTAYERQIVVKFEDDTSTFERVIPISYDVYSSLRRSLQLVSGTSNERFLYDPGGFRGGFDWNGWSEAGDWRVYYVELRNPRTAGMFVDFRWSLDNSSLIIYTLGPDGQYAGYYYGAGISYLEDLGDSGDGIFGMAYVSGNGAYQRRMVSMPNTVYFDQQYPHKANRHDRIFTILVQQVLHGGTDHTDSVDGKVSAIGFVRKFRDVTRARTDTLVRIRDAVRMARLSDLWVEPYIAPGAGNFSVYICMSGIQAATGDVSLGATIDEWNTTRVYRPGRIISTYEANSAFIIPTDPGDYLAGVEYLLSIPKLSPWYLDEGNPIEIWAPYYGLQDWTWVRAA